MKNIVTLLTFLALSIGLCTQAGAPHVRTAGIPYGEYSLVHDSEGLDWENKAVPSFGARLGIPMENQLHRIRRGLRTGESFQLALGCQQCQGLHEL